MHPYNVPLCVWKVTIVGVKAVLKLSWMQNVSMLNGSSEQWHILSPAGHYSFGKLNWSVFVSTYSTAHYHMRYSIRENWSWTNSHLSCFVFKPFFKRWQLNVCSRWPMYCFQWCLSNRAPILQSLQAVVLTIGSHFKYKTARLKEKTHIILFLLPISLGRNKNNNSKYRKKKKRASLFR